MRNDLSSDMSREMNGLEESIEVVAPVRTVYNQWTRFEDFPRLMEGVESVTQLDDGHLHWITEFGGRRKEWDAEITRQVPDEEIDWIGLGDPDNRGRVIFEDLTGVDGPRTKVTLMLDYETEGPVEKLGDAVGLVRRRVQADLIRFKDYIEARSTDTGGWRGEIHAGTPENPGA